MQAALDTKDGKATFNADENLNNGRQLKTIYEELLKFPNETKLGSGQFSVASGNRKQIIAGTLHESSEEFPCFHVRPEDVAETSSSRVSYHVCLFLGAVRDMTSHENQLLEKVCEASKIPFVGVRFGTVPEFTSKILSLLVFHHANQVIGVSMKRILDQTTKTQHNFPSTTSNCQQQSTFLNIICTVPKSSKEISTKPEERDQIHWRLVRVIVCSLWRSKVVSSRSHNISHTNKLHLVFDDGAVVVLTEREFVEKLASQHQAAPSEFQILKALVQEIDRQSKSREPPPPSSKAKNNNGDCGGWSRKKLAKRLVKSVVKSSPIPVTCTVGIESNGTDELVSRFYGHSSTVVSNEEAIGSEDDESRNHGLLIVVDLTAPPEFSKQLRLANQAKPGHKGRKPQGPREIYRQLLSASKKLQRPTIRQTILLNNDDWCWDREAASIIAIQHMCYQNRVFARQCFHASCEAEPSQDSGKKRKKPS
jgi:hypothetical protein